MNPDGTKSNTKATAVAEAVGADAHVPGSRYHEAFDFAPDAQFVTDGAGVILEANPAAAILFHCAKEFLIGKPLALFSAEGARARFYEALWRLRQGTATDTFESRITRKNEVPRDVHVVVRAGGRNDPRPALHWQFRDVTEWKRTEVSRAELRQLLSTAQEHERRRVARDLHDTVGQMLTALALGVRAVRDAAPLPEVALARLEHVQRLADELARQVHELATRLRPTALDDLGLEAAARQLASDWSLRAGVTIDFQAVSFENQRLPPEVETTLYRVVQEALTNVAKHAKARRVAVVIGQSDGCAMAVVEDDGVGFDTESISHNAAPARGENRRLGLLGMRERVTLVGGTLEIESTPGQGTTVIARIPLR